MAVCRHPLKEEMLIKEGWSQYISKNRCINETVDYSSTTHYDTLVKMITKSDRLNGYCTNINLIIKKKKSKTH